MAFEDQKLNYTEREMSQTYRNHKAFTHTATSDVSEKVLDITAFMTECNKLSFVIDLFDAYVEFDNDASTSTMLIPKNEGYSDDGIYIKSSINIINATSGSNTRIRGIAWGR